ncbi:hypothetical protein BD414DRAFT_511877 [Trametes punicea]|nr:hypothetical protein BD414DRAFT_511877 [Trametes punicea]
MSVISDREAKKLEKLMAKEAKAEEKHIQHALKDVQKAEKAVKKCLKAIGKAEKEKEKAVKKEHSTMKALIKAKHQQADVLEKETKLEGSLASKRERESEAERQVEQLHEDLENLQVTITGNARERESRLADVFAHCGEQDTVPSSAQLASRL